MWHHVERMTHCRIKKHPPQIKRGGCFFVFGKNFNLMTLRENPCLFCAFCYTDFENAGTFSHVFSSEKTTYYKGDRYEH